MAEEIKKEQAEETADQTVAQQEKAEPKSKESRKEAKKSEQLQKKIEELEKENAALTDKLSGEHNDYMRLMAEFETFRRRSAEDRLNLVSVASADTIKELLPVLDACEQAMKMLENSADESAKEGTKLIYEKLLGSLSKRGLAKIEALGQAFDADLHEAIAQFPAPSEELKGKVLDVTRTGYSLNGKVIRYPQVVVGA